MVFLSFIFFLIVHTASNGYLIFLNCRPQSRLRRVFNLYLVCFVFTALLAIIDHQSGPRHRTTAVTTADAV